MVVVPLPSITVFATTQRVALEYLPARKLSLTVVQPFTAAHKTLPCGAVVRVTTRTGRSVIVTIRDRGPFIRGRVIDLDRVSAGYVGLIGPGVLPVTVERLR